MTFSMPYKWSVKLPGAVYAITVTAKTEQEARAEARKTLRLRRLPKGTEVYLYTGF